MTSLHGGPVVLRPVRATPCCYMAVQKRATNEVTVLFNHAGIMLICLGQSQCYIYFQISLFLFQHTCYHINNCFQGYLHVFMKIC